MKLVLNYKESVKLYIEELKYKKVVDFVESQINLRRDSIVMSYIDSDGDKIGIGSDEDLTIMLSLLDGNDYIKIHIDGVPLSKNDSTFNQTRVRVDEVLVNLKDEKDELKIDTDEQPRNICLSDDQEESHDDSPLKEKQQKNQKKTDRITKRNERKVKKEKPEKKLKTNPNFETFNTLMSESIATIVDERVRALIPCIREQALSKNYKMQDLQNKLIHEKYTCFLCEVHPIVGVRYDCPKCQNFSLCEHCESTYDHEHNLIKIKHLEDISKKKIETTIKDLYDKFFQGKATLKEPKKEVSKGKINNESQRRLCRDLKLTFGGKIVDYTKVVQNNPQAPLIKIIEKYCQENDINQEEGHKKYIELLLNRMSKKFKKEDPQTIRIFIEEHSNMEYKDIEKLYDQGLKEKNAELKKILKAEKQKEKQEKEKERKEKKEKEEQRKKEAERSRKEMKKDKKEPGDTLEGQQKDIYTIMVELCGKERSAEYPAFIKKHKSLTKEDIVQSWWNQISYIEHQN